MSTEATLRVRDLSVAYTGGGTQRLALDRVDLDVAEGEILGVVGESGSGKSTLTTTILGLLPANGRLLGGTVGLRGRGDLAGLGDEEMRAVRGGEISVIFQDPATSLNPRLPVGAQMLQVLRAHRRQQDAGGATRDRLVAALTEVGIPNPEQALNRYPHAFSGGMRQRVMIAMALLLRPKLIIADEATSALDLTLEAQILELLLRLRDEHGTSLLFISHDLGVVAQLCDRVSVMYAGRVIEETAGTAVLTEPAHPYTQALNAAVPMPGTRGRRLATVDGRMPDIAEPLAACGFAPRCRHATDLCTTESPDMYPTPSGAARCFAVRPEHAALWPRRPSTDDWRVPSARADGDAVTGDGGPDAEAPLMVVDDLAVHFGGGRRRAPVRAVDGVSLTLRRGQVLGIVGESGSGKTTLGEALVKLLRPTRGTIVFNGADITKLSAADTHRFRRRVQMIFQNVYTSLSPRVRVGEQVTEPYRIHRIEPGKRRSAGHLMAAVNLPESLARAYPSQLSGGQARRIGIARALAGEPDLVVADEPTAGLDQSAAAATINLLGDLRDRTGLAVVLVSHSLPQVVAVADEICVMYFGQVVERGTTESITTRPAHPYTKALLALAPDPEPGHRLARRRLLVGGEVPSPDSPPQGCRFHPRCSFARDVCRTTAPPQVPVHDADGPEHLAACHFAHEIAAGTRTPNRDPADA
ncbi:MAG TPA: ABC transporter ATP-binding protein [Streptosporangiaceae bacterium]